MFRVLAEKAEYAQRLAVDCRHGAQEWRFLVQSLTAVGAERGGNAQSAVLYERVRGGIPRRIAARFEGGAQTAGGEGGSVRLAFDKFRTGKFHYDFAVFRTRYERIVLFRGNARHRLEPVREVGAALFNRPVLHGVRHHVGNFQRKRAVFFDAPVQFLVGGVGQALLHDRVVENKSPENFVHVHKYLSFVRAIKINTESV